MAFTSETSNSGFKAPSAILAAEFGMVAGEDFEPVFSGAHDASILGVVNQDYPAAAIANSVLGRMIERDVVTEDQYVTIYTSQTFPTTGYGTAYNLTPELQEIDPGSVLQLRLGRQRAQAEFSNSTAKLSSFPITFQENWAVIRTIDEANGVVYECN
jgi:phosphonate transport system substrate-binding protein